MGNVIILPETTYDPITIMGKRAGVCWGADTQDNIANYQRGWDCITSGHGRVMEYVNVEMVLEGYSARVMREWYTHIGGAPTRLQESTRYMDYDNFDYIIPRNIAKDDVMYDVYRNCMEYIRDSVKWFEQRGAKREDIANLLPLGMKTRIVDKRNLRNLVDMSHTRMCARAYWEFRQLFDDIAHALMEYSDEWDTIVNTQFNAKCKVLGRCPEKNSCGLFKEGERERDHNA